MAEHVPHIRERSGPRPQLKHESAPQRSERRHPLLTLQGQAGNSAIARLVQREAAPEDEEEMVQALHDNGAQAATVGPEGGALDGNVAREIDSMRGTGSGVASSVRDRVEPALGFDLSAVRVHQDSKSDSIARSITAKAFTTGTDVFLRGDQSPADHSLMAHELTHVVQQAGGAGSSGGSGMTVGAAGDQHEVEADRMAQAITSGGTVERCSDDEM
jgi:hypothetical protein